MIKYSKFTNNIESGNFTDIFCQNSKNFEIIVCVCVGVGVGGGGGGGGGGGRNFYSPPHPLLGMPLLFDVVINDIFYMYACSRDFQKIQEYLKKKGFKVIENWLHNNYMLFNSWKSEFISFGNID